MMRPGHDCVAVVNSTARAELAAISVVIPPYARLLDPRHMFTVVLAHNTALYRDERASLQRARYKDGSL